MNVVQDHKANDHAEMERVIQQGGFVIQDRLSGIVDENTNQDEHSFTVLVNQKLMTQIEELLAATEISTRCKIPTIQSIQLERMQSVDEELAAASELDTVLSSHKLSGVSSVDIEKLQLLIKRLRQQEQQLSFHRGLLKAQQEFSGSDSEYSAGNFAFGSTPFPTWLNLFTQSSVVDAIARAPKRAKLTVFGSSSGSLVLFAAITFGISCVGVEILPFLCEQAAQTQETLRVSKENCRFLCADMLTVPLQDTFLLLLTSQCWDAELYQQVQRKLETELQPGTLVLDYKNTLHQSPHFRIVQHRNEASASGWDVSWATGATAMLYRTLVRDADKYSPLFIGCPEVFVAKGEEAALEKQLLALRCVPVFLDPPVAHRYFQGFCKGVLWPVFHNVVDVYNSAELQLDCEEKKSKAAKAWFAGKKDESSTVTSAWCDPVSWNPAAQDMCWSDYCSVNRHFLTSCKRLLGLDYKTCPNGMLVMEYNGRKIHISCSHVEPDVTHLHEMLDQNEANVNGAALDFAAHVKNAITTGRNPDEHRLVIGSVDRLEGLTAVPLKLRAFDRFLATHPDKRGSVVLVQIGIALDSRPNDYHRTREYVQKFTKEINRRYAPPGGVVVYFEEKRKTTCAERVILWRMCDVYLDTCVRGGLSLLPFEYMIAQHRNILSKSKPSTGWSSPRGDAEAGGLDRSFGIMIVSEFSAYSRILSGSLPVNPWKTDDMAAAFSRACSMSYYEKHNRFYLNYKFLVGKSDANPWGERLLADIEAVTDKTQDASSGEVVQVGFGFDFRVMRFESGFVSLDVDDLVRKCNSASRRLFILDYGGTLSSTASILDEEGAQYSYRGDGTDHVFQTFDVSDRYGGECTVQSAARYIDGKVRKPISDETRANLRTLCADPCNIVFVTSNTQRAALEAQFGSIPHLNLIAENGLFIKKAGNSGWECVCDEDKRTFDWKDDAKRVMQAYAARTNGSFLVENAASLLYDYRNSDQEYGEIQSLELCAQLRHIVESLVDLLLATIYVAEYCVTEFSADSVVLPFRIAAITQALLIAGEFWFFAIPIDMVQSITNPFTSYAHNFRVYWFYSVLSGIVCGLVLWFLGDAEVECIDSDDVSPDCVKVTSEGDQRFIWFHHNTDMPGFFWHQWILYHVCVVVYLLFGLACMAYVRSRLRRGLEETFEVRRRVLSNGMLTCAVFISWSFLMICLFAMTNTATVKHVLGKTLFKELIDLSAFMHASRGCVNIIVWIVVNAPFFPSIYSEESAAATLQSPYGNGLLLRGSFSPRATSSECTEASDSKHDSHKHEEKLMNPQLNVALRKQMIHMATNGIIESIQHHHRMRRENGNNHTFQLDWQRSPQRRIRQLFSSSSHDVGSMTIPPRSMPILREMRSSNVRVVEEPRDNPSNMRFTFMPMALTEMQFYDFQPRVFASIRQLYGVNDAEYILAFRSTINERISEGRSGAFVFNTCDRKYLVKSTTSKEKDVLLRLLPSYLRYLKWNPGTLLPRFFGFHAMKMYGQIFYFIVMGNFLSTTEVIHRRYDIKGSWEDRNAPACVLGEKYRCSKCNRFFTFGGAPGEPCFLPGEEHYPDITLRDNDLKKRLKLDSETASKLVKQLTRDSNYLASAGIMDYSLLIGTHYSHFTITTEYKRGISRRKSVELTAYCADAHELKTDAEFLPALIGTHRSPSEDDVMSEGTRPSESSEVSFGGRLSDVAQSPGPTESAVYPQSHSYHAHQVSGPSKLSFILPLMLPPLNLADGKGGFFSRKRVDGGETIGASSTRKRSSVKIIRASPRASIHVPISHTSRSTGGEREHDDKPFSTSHGLSPRQRAIHESVELTEISMIPREFFVVETNSILLPQNYPPSQYKSTLNAQGQWETVVFPALTPNNRQQVLYLRQTLDKMRATMPQFEEKNEGVGPETEADSTVLAERRRLMVEYTSQETRIYSFCFHELARQIKCICKEQSELLHEIRERYDAAVARLINQVEILAEQNNQQQDQMIELSAKYKHALQEIQMLEQKADELEHQIEVGPPEAAAQEALRLRKTKGRGHRLPVDNDVEVVDSTEKRDEVSDSDIDDEEAEWRRQRNASSVGRPSVSSKGDSTKELHLAATRLQVAFQKYQARKEQTRVTLRVEKQAAAMDIQRSYRGFRERQLALHRRAIMRTILRRREEVAAVELMQANVRAYLLNRRRSAKLKLSAVANLKLVSDSDLMTTPVPIVDNTSAAVVVPAISNESNDITSEDSESKEPTEQDKQNPRQALIRLLTTFRELASVITLFQRGEVRSAKDEEDVTTTEDATSPEDDPILPPHPASASPTESLDDEDVELFQQTMLEAQALVGSLHVVLGTVPEEKPVGDDEEMFSDDSSADLDNDEAAQTDDIYDQDQRTQADNDDIDTTLQTDVGSQSDGNSFDGYDDNSITIPFGERDAMRLQNYAELHLDDSLWSSAIYYPASREDMAEIESLLALALASREQRKRLVALKQFISDIYDTIVGKLKELPPRRIAEMIASRCHLTLSFSEWRQQRSNIFTRDVAADQPGEQTMPIKFSIEHVTREHFRCRLGLPPLIDAAVASLHENITDFAEVDPDVKRFQEFMANERSEEELVFCCMCRYLCANRLMSDERPAGTASSSYHRQPMFHPVTMREVIDVPHVLDLAKLLFRVEDESAIIESDTHFTEVENVVYREYLPTNGFQQFKAIVSSYFIDPDSQAAAVSTINEADDGQADNHSHANSCRRPPGSPRRASAMVRPTNFNQFHSKQYNLQASRSPVVRRQRQRSMQTWSPTAAIADELKWVYFEEVLALLIKYRGEMNHFHLFSYWVQELFGLAASSTVDDNSSSALCGRETPPSSVKLLDDASFVETLTPLSLGPNERELRNIFHNSLRQRKLQVFMPLRVFTSVALLLLRNGLLSVSTYAPLQKPGVRDEEPLRTRQRTLSIREENEDKEWRSLALKWRTQEAAFEAAIEAIYHEPPSAYMSSPVDHPGDDGNAPMDRTRSAHALQLLQLRQELYDLFASRAGRGRDLRRAHDIYEILVNERLTRVGGDTRMLDAHLESSSLGSTSISLL
ncbi:unnamed protein product [Phytophthora fragariaefolia]|uniref:Unnamed protein product n=1 Tax=Phytophthora fragariaefolia TaxID=1490495 RepID=A0A9W6TV27_9STRA|nr:unnamed protein product [Phytophthora fragariaefolia]